jgi:nicotinamidase-related amidase
MSLFLRAGRKQRDAQRTDRLNTLIISGTVSQVCCEATARDAMMMNYKVFFRRCLRDNDGRGTWRDIVRDGARVL